MSTDQDSHVGSPASIHSARNFPAPPALAMPTELNPAATNKCRISGASPMMRLLSGVKLSGPLTNLANLHFARVGMRCFPLANGTENFSQSGSNNWNENFSGTLSTIQGLEDSWKAPSMIPSP